MSTVADDLRKAAELFEERHALYGPAYKKVGVILAVLFPQGVTLKTLEDHNRYHLLGWIIGKLVRYASNFETGGHDDSIKDAGVYCAMLRHYDEETKLRNYDKEKRKNG